MGPVEALQLALKKEIEAKEAYGRFYNQYPEVREIFMFLMNEEEKHEKLIRDKISAMTRY